MPVVYVEREKVSVLRILNDTGFDIAQDEFTVLHGFNAIAEGAVPHGEYGGFQVEEGIQVQAGPADLKTGENTFATLGQVVYYNATNKTFSDTRHDAYTRAGILTQAKDAGGVIIFDKFRYAEEVYPAET